MARTEIPLRIVAVEQMADGAIIVTFSNGFSAVYHAQFLFDVRDHDHNVVVERPREP